MKLRDKLIELEKEIEHRQESVTKLKNKAKRLLEEADKRHMSLSSVNSDAANLVKAQTLFDKTQKL